MTQVLELVGIKDSKTQLLINGILQIVNFITAVGMCFFVDKIGRRKLFLVSTAGMLGAFVVWTICSSRFKASNDKAAANAVVVVSEQKRRVRILMSADDLRVLPILQYCLVFASGGLPD
jgi:MFS family permease